MDIAITSAIALFMLPALLPGLRHPFYLLHLLIVVALSWLIELHYTGHVAIFSRTAWKVALCLHVIFINAATFAIYAWDKRASRYGGWRVPERSLHAFALVGGTVGAWLGQRILRHKTRKRDFQLAFWLTFVLQIIGIFVLFVRSL